MQKQLAIIDGIATPRGRLSRQADSSASSLADRIYPALSLPVMASGPCTPAQHQLQQCFLHHLANVQDHDPFFLGWNCIRGTCGWRDQRQFLVKSHLNSLGAETGLEPATFDL